MADFSAPSPATPASRGHVFWLFGLSGAGKSTLAEALRGELLRVAGEKALMLDGDRLRAGLCAGLGFSQEDRLENIRRAAEVARVAVESELTVIAAFITPREELRQRVRALIGAGRVSLIHVKAALETCRQRDVKGLYARAAAGGVSQMTGVSSVFEPPEHVELQVETDRETIMVSAQQLTEFAWTRLGPPAAAARSA